MKYSAPTVTTQSARLFEDSVCNTKYVCDAGSFTCTSFKCKKEFKCLNSYSNS